MKATSIPKDRFAKTIQKALRDAGDATTYQYDREQFWLVADTGTGTILLSNVYQQYCSAPPARWPEVLRHIIRGMLAHLRGIPEKYEDAKSDLLPRITRRGDCEAERIEAQVLGKPGSVSAYCPLADHLAVGLSYDLRESLVLLSEDNLSSWAPTGQFFDWQALFQDAINVALKNLARCTESGLEQLTTGLWASSWHDSLDAARLLLPNFIQSHPVKGEHVVLVPNRDKLLVTGSDDDPGLSQMAELGEQALNQPYEISGIPLRFDGVQWSPFALPATSPAARRFKKLELLTSASAYAGQAHVLRKQLQHQGQDVFVANVLVASKPLGESISVSAWSKDVRTLLPRTEHVSFVEIDRLSPIGSSMTRLLPWDAVQQVVGARMKPMGLWPERYRVDSFPTRDEFKAIADIASQQGKLLKEAFHR